MIATKHPFQRLRYGVVRAALIEALAYTYREAEAVLRDDARLPSFIPPGSTQKKWLAKDVLDFIRRVQQDGGVSLGKGSTGGGTS